MNIALDYDETYTLDPQLWQNFIHFAVGRQHKVYIVTFRHSDNLITENIECSGIYYTDHKQKSEYMKHKNIHIDVWIDDTPKHI
jgi:hypothetical protein